MKGRAVARRYAKAMIALAVRDHMIAEIGEQLSVHRELLHAHEDLLKFLHNPSVDAEAKTNILAAVLDRTQPQPLLRNFLMLLLEKDRLRQFDLICEYYEKMANARLHRVMAQVTAAVELDENQRQAVTQKLADATQSEITLETRLDPSLLGGLVVRIGDMVLDGSLRGQLTRLRQELRGG